MRIAIVNSYDISGGAARAAYRLHQALLSANVDSKMIVQEKASDDFTVTLSVNNALKGIRRFRPAMDSLLLKSYPEKTQTLFSPAWLPFSGIVDKINSLNPDIVHLHWICGGLLRIEDLTKIEAPIVWSLHDMWAFTGGCHYDEFCGRYLEKCGNCPVLGSKMLNDLSHKVFSRKLRAFSKVDFTIVGLSRWLASCAEKSSLFRNRKIVNLPNPINTDIFAPVEKSLAKRLLGFPLDKKIILFGAVNATGDPRKGFNELAEALKQLQSKNIELVVFGASKPKCEPQFGISTHYLGMFYDDISLKILYSAADVMVVPSLQENLSNAIIESLASGTPVVGFNIGGNSDMIEHLKNGYLAEAIDPADLAKGIDWVLDTPVYQDLCANAREKAVREFDSKTVVCKYIALYDKIIRRCSLLKGNVKD